MAIKDHITSVINDIPSLFFYDHTAGQKYIIIIMSYMCTYTCFWFKFSQGDYPPVTRHRNFHWHFRDFWSMGKSWTGTWPWHVISQDNEIYKNSGGNGNRNKHDKDLVVSTIAWKGNNSGDRTNKTEEDMMLPRIWKLFSTILRGFTKDKEQLANLPALSLALNQNLC